MLGYSNVGRRPATNSPTAMPAAHALIVTRTDAANYYLKCCNGARMTRETCNTLVLLQYVNITTQ